MSHADLDKFAYLSQTYGYRAWLRRRLILPEVMREQGLFPLLLSTILGEISGNIVYVVLIEMAFKLGGEAASVGGVLLIQSAPQIFLGVWAGSMVDRLGKRKAAILFTFVYAALVGGLVVGKTILVVYVLAFMLMLVRLVVTPARISLVSHISSKANLVAANTAFSMVTGFSLFVGPAIGAGLILLSHGFQVPLLIAGLGLLLSVLPLSFVPAPGAGPRSDELMNIWEEMRTGWQYIRSHSHVWKVLLCLVHYTLIMGVVTPLIAPLAHGLGLGSEGTGIFFAAVGFGGLVGASLAVLLAKRLGATLTLLLAGLLAPLGLLFVGLTDNLGTALAALMVTALAGASLNVIVVTVLQRLTPSKIQGSVFGVQQTFMGTAWAVSLALTTGGLVIWPEVDAGMLLFVVGGAGVWAFLACWFRHWRPIRRACEMCEPRFQMLGAVCQAICESKTQVSGVTCRLICGLKFRCFD